jgi:capsular polysaccharide biosynthesis protein
MKRAKVILGPHGGAFANIAFAQPGTHVIEFIPIYKLYKQSEGDARRNFWGLSQAAGLDYWALDTERFSFDEPGMVVDPAKLLTILQKLL